MTTRRPLPTWSRPLVERVERPACGCPRSFDPLTRAAVTRCSSGATPLFQLSRRAILRAIPLSRLEQARRSLPLPKPLLKVVCQLSLDDFVINPYTVRTESVQKNVYDAGLCFSMQKVKLLINKSNNKSTASHLGGGDLITYFEEDGIVVYVYKSSISLKEVLQAHERMSKPVTAILMWQVVKAVARYVIDNPGEHYFALSNIKMNDDDCYVSPSSPAKNDSEFADNNNNRDVTSIYKVSVSGIGQVARHILSINHKISANQNSLQSRLLQRRAQQNSADKANSNSNSNATTPDDSVFKSLIHYCMSPTNQSKVCVKKILFKARKFLGEESILPPLPT